MRDPTSNLPTPADEDPVVHRYLVALPRFSPVPDFSDRVLLRVWRPIPPRLRRFQAALAKSRWPWVIVGTLAAGSLLGQAVAAGVIAQHRGEASVLLDWVAPQGLAAAWAALTALAIDVLTPPAEWLEAGVTENLAVWAAVGLGVLVASALGLFLTVKTSPATRGASHDTR